jgi:hypothetical protein
MGVDFHLTRMGQKFFESTLPHLVEELAKLNQNLANLIALLATPNDDEDE